jgi:hypothetical protein
VANISANERTAFGTNSGKAVGGGGGAGGFSCAAIISWNFWNSWNFLKVFKSISAWDLS